MKKSINQSMFSTRNTCAPGHIGRIMRRVAGGVRSFTRSGRKRNSIRTASPVSALQNTWKLKRLARSLLLVFMVASVFAGTGWVSFLLLRSSDVFRVTSVQVLGNSVVTKKQVLDSAGLNHGINLLEIDVAGVENKVLSLPWINEVAVSRHWPSSVEIAVREYRPLALFNYRNMGESRLYYLDAQGNVFAPLSEGQDLDFPVLTGTDITGNLLQMQVQPETMTALALQVLNLAARGNQILPLQAISEVHVDEDKGVVLYLVDHPFPIYMGKEKVRHRFNLLVRVLAQLYRQDKVKEIAEIHMDYAEDRIMVAGTGAS